MAILFVMAGVLLFLSLVSFSPNDLPFYTSTPNVHLSNRVGPVGAYIGFVFLFLFGKTAYLLAAVFFILAAFRFLKRSLEGLLPKSIGGLTLLVSASSFISLLFAEGPDKRMVWGGVTGIYFSDLLTRYLAFWGSFIVLMTIMLLSLAVVSEFYVLRAVGVFFRKMFLIPGWIAGLRKKKVLKPAPKLEIRTFAQKSVTTLKQQVRPEPVRAVSRPVPSEPKPAQPRIAPQPGSGYALPSTDLLDSPPPIEEREIKEDLHANARILEETLKDFGIEVKMTGVDQGPVVTRYELQPGPGVKVQRITGLSDDLALAMKAHSVRIVAPLPGKGTVGVEVPNTTTTLVYLREILESKQFQANDLKLKLSLGKDIAGQPLVTDLSDMPHLLIAGTTGSGKTVCVNSLIMSILFKLKPDEVKFLMVDPKMVELASFNGLPHLLCPVVNNAKKVPGALAWIINEMEERYRLCAAVGARNIDIYNKKIETSGGKIEGEEEPLKKFPYIVVVIDELADLMLVASNEIEGAITRLAQLSRAVGIHMILATQRPSVDVITGVIKANFPARISFRVASKVDSRTVLDMNGADKLLGRGDMLFLRPETMRPVRAQGTLVADHEIEKVVNFIKSQKTPVYNEEILTAQEERLKPKYEEKDELFDEAVKVVLETGQASASMLQRRLRLGYTRAARLIDQMEDDGVVGPPEGSKPRRILNQD